MWFVHVSSEKVESATITTIYRESAFERAKKKGLTEMSQNTKSSQVHVFRKLCFRFAVLCKLGLSVEEKLKFSNWASMTSRQFIRIREDS